MATKNKILKLKEPAYDAFYRKLVKVIREGEKLNKSSKSSLLVLVLSSNDDEDECQTNGVLRCSGSMVVQAMARLHEATVH